MMEYTGELGEDGGRFFMFQMVDALDYIHKCGVAHLDLKLENILLDGDLNIKVSDFGFATNENLKRLT